MVKHADHSIRFDDAVHDTCVRQTCRKGPAAVEHRVPFLTQGFNKGGRSVDRGKNDLTEPQRRGEYDGEIHHQPKVDHEVN